MTTPAPSGKGKLGERLVQLGILSQAQLTLALTEQRRSGGLLGDVLEKLGFVTQTEISRILARDTQADFVDLENVSPQPQVLRLITPDMARAQRMFPIELSRNVLTLAMADTFNITAVDIVERQTGLQVKVVAAPEFAINNAIELHYFKAVTIDELVEEALRTGAALQDEVERSGSLVKLVDQIISQAIRKRATDIHIEPDESMVRLRFRIDGLLRQETLIPKVLQPAIEARIKIQANLDVTEHRLPQDGRIAIKFARRMVDLRVSVLPTQFGSSIVMRVLDRNASVISMESLGISGEAQATIREATSKQHGIFLVTGPTGSGKTTTLYSALATLDSVQHSIFTLEDPIEYRLPMLRQTQINAEIGMSFAHGLRSLLRQDPDIILVGEIRDEETAQLATRAALTGHLVLSTLHTNSAAGAIPRLIDMGVEPYLISSSLIGVMAQRLVRRICNDCAVEDTEAPHLARMRHLHIPDNATFRKGLGCPTCNNTGYYGRMAMCEIFIIDDDISDVIKPGIDSKRLEELASAKGMQSLLQDGLNKAFAGLCQLEDVLKVVG